VRGYYEDKGDILARLRRVEGQVRGLQEWCSFELHTVVMDTGESPLEDDEFEK
jgi:hypothetical protein